MTRRTLTLPLDHLDAELLAAPFAELTALRAAPVELDPRLRAAPTVRLWRAAEQRLAAASPGLSLDELVARRDRVWFPRAGRARAVPLADVLRDAFAHLARDGADGGAPAVQRRRMRWLRFALPRDLLDCFADGSAPPAPPVAPIVTRLLAEGVVEPHLHLGAAVDFETLWVAAQHTLADDRCTAHALQSPGAVFDEGRGLATWLLRGLIARAVLAAFLGAAEQRAFPDWLNDKRRRLEPLDRLALDRALDSLCPPANGSTVPSMAPSDPVGPEGIFARLRAIYRFLVGIGPGFPPLPATLDGIRRADGIASWFPADAGRSSEQRYILAAVHHIEHAPGSRLFATLFWQTVRLRVILYRHLVQRPLVGGLQWFTRTFGRIPAVRGAMSPHALVEGAERLGGVGLTGLELRFKPAAPLSHLIAQLRGIAGAARQPVGLALHLTRSRGRHHPRGAPPARGIGTHGEPTGAWPFRYGQYYRERLAEAQAIIDLLCTRPQALEWLRGVDICGDELGVPLWVLAPMLGEIRRVGRLAAERIADRRCAVTAPRLMVHAGEDYVHLLGGLRRIDELIEYLDLGEGDRVAHALALGEDVERWCGGAFARVQAREERLLDLLWVWRRLRDEPSAELSAWGTWLEAELRRLIHHVFGCAHAIETVSAAHDLLFDGNALRRLGFPSHPLAPVPAGEDLALARRWLTDRGVFHRGREPEEVHPRRIAPLVEALQIRVRRRLGERSVVVEINPSSNLLVGGFSDLGQHPLWRLRPVESDDRPSLMVCIGSDDPITFATSLPEEYQLVYDTLIEAGVSSDKALRWLDDARRASRLACVIPADSGGEPRGLGPWRQAVSPIPSRGLPA